MPPDETGAEACWVTLNPTSVEGNRRPHDRPRLRPLLQAARQPSVNITFYRAISIFLDMAL